MESISLNWWVIGSALVAILLAVGPTLLDLAFIISALVHRLGYLIWSSAGGANTPRRLRFAGAAVALCVAVAASGVIRWPSLPDKRSDAVSEAFDTYEQLWRDAALRTAEGLEDGTLQDEKATRDFFGSAGSAAREAAFRPLVTHENEVVLKDWTPEAHAKLLRGYVR